MSETASPEMRAAVDLLNECGSTERALRAAMWAMRAPMNTPDFWLRVYLHIETLGVIREAVKGNE